MMVGSHYYIGLSERTNLVGASQLQAFLAEHALTSTLVPVSTALHLKSVLTYLEHETLLTEMDAVLPPALQHMKNVIQLPSHSPGLNCVNINDHVLVPAGYPQLEADLKKRMNNVDLIRLDLSEFQKLDGGLTCLSLRF